MKKIKIIGIFIIFILSFISHFIYDFIPSFLNSILFPVNESIWEHMKLLVTPTLIFAIIEFLIYRKKGIYYDNFLLSYVISITVGIIIYLIIYLPVHYIFGHNLIFAVILLLVTFIIIQFISYKLMNCNTIENYRYISIISIFIIYIIFGYLTYNPPKINLFYDSNNKHYGIRH